MGSRLDGWEVMLAEFIESVRDKPFKWGEHDCTTFAMDARALLTGKRGPDWRGKYKTAKGSARQLKRMGFDTLESAGRGILGRQLQTPLFAQRGDIVLIDDPDTGDDVFGVCVGALAFVVTDAGLCGCPIASARIAWRV